ncbi:histidine phosphatase family protein, partial [Enterococcus faecalis]
CEPEAWDDIIEAGNRFEGLRVNAWNSQLWNPVRWPLLRDPSIPSWGEPYEEIAARMLATAKRAAKIAEGHEAILVSHELPIVMVQRSVAGQPLPHNPARRKCALAS